MKSNGDCKGLVTVAFIYNEKQKGWLKMKTVEELAQDIYCSIEHGECLYDKGMFDSLIEDIHNLLNECHKEFLSNQKD